MSQSSDQLSITLKHSPIGRPYKQRLYLQGLGLRKLHQTVRRPKTPQVLGLIRKVKHLVEVNDQ
ncbi:MAG: 50S ribosomal protein L30 [Nitrospira sp.]|nr:50S ribosomal protein L30 [Nitrospira sp.]MCY3954555.1 50S ribosomal protein L30 [Nitrospira sp.]MCY4133047.1 50S ribosomal protein L30 [Nitrospira sp.]